MSKHHTKQAWATWKIVAVAIACAAIGTAFFVMYARMPAISVAASQPGPAKTPTGAPDPMQQGWTRTGLSNIVVLLGLMGWGIALVFAGWLGYRMYMRIPAWRRRQWFGGRR